jgi:hypothetical protein
VWQSSKFPVLSLKKQMIVVPLGPGATIAEPFLCVGEFAAATVGTAKGVAPNVFLKALGVSADTVAFRDAFFALFLALVVLAFLTMAYLLLCISLLNLRLYALEVRCN